MTKPMPFPTSGGAYRFDGKALTREDDTRPLAEEPPAPPDSDLTPDPGTPPSPPPRGKK